MRLNYQLITFKSRNSSISERPSTQMIGQGS